MPAGCGMVTVQQAVKACCCALEESLIMCCMAFKGDISFVPPQLQVLLTYKGQQLAVLEVESKWVPNKTLETKLCYGSTSLEHPGTLMVATERGKYYLGGKVFGLDLPQR